MKHIEGDLKLTDLETQLKHLCPPSQVVKEIQQEIDDQIQDKQLLIRLVENIQDVYHEFIEWEFGKESYNLPGAEGKKNWIFKYTDTRETLLKVQRSSLMYLL